MLLRQPQNGTLRSAIEATEINDNIEGEFAALEPASNLDQRILEVC